MPNLKSLEARLRRQLQNDGYILRKTPSQDLRRFGTGYIVVDAFTNIPCVGYTPQPYSADLEDVEAWIKGE